MPLQRDPALGTRAYLTDEEFAQRQKQASRQAEADSEEFAAPAGGGEEDGTGPRTIGSNAGRRSVRHRSSSIRRTDGCRR